MSFVLFMITIPYEEGDLIEDKDIIEEEEEEKVDEEEKPPQVRVTINVEDVDEIKEEPSVGSNDDLKTVVDGDGAAVAGKID